MSNGCIEAAQQGPHPGDRPPGCFGMTADRRFYSFEEQYGRPVVLILVGSAALPSVMPVVRDFTAEGDAFADRNADVLLLMNDNPAVLWQRQTPAIRTVDCGTFLARCGLGPTDVMVLVLDRNLRVAYRELPPEQPGLTSRCLACLDTLPREPSVLVSQPAPVIVLPNLLPRALCQDLIDRFENSPTMEGEVARVDASGAVRSVVDREKKCRRDMPIAESHPLHGHLRHALMSRCAPDIAKAFQANVSHMDRILVARYDDTGGWFRRHRDNAAQHLAFREFALSLNLNTEEYEGGTLSFPECNDHRYSPPTGGGIIFSTSLLHEAAPVTRGRRYVLLTFLHSAAAEARRLANPPA